MYWWVMGIRLDVEHVIVGNGYTTWCRTCNGGWWVYNLIVEHVMVGNGYTTWCRTCNGG